MSSVDLSGPTHVFLGLLDSISNTVVGLSIRKGRGVLLDEGSAVACGLLREVWEICVPSLLVIKWLLEIGTSVWVSVRSPLFLGGSGTRFVAFPIAVTVSGESDGRGGCYESGNGSNFIAFRFFVSAMPSFT